MTWQAILPVLVSIVIIIAIAALRGYSKTLAAITATMPVNVALTLWIAYSGENGDKIGFEKFTRSLAQGIVPTTLFVLSAYLASKAGWTIAQILIASYAVWAIAVGIMFWVFGTT
jgi:hypothetical protein